MPPGPARPTISREGRPEFGENMRRYYEYIRENDLTLTHSLINLQRSRTVSGMFNLQEGTALQVVRETDAGIVVRGARILATLGPISDEIGVYSPRMAQHTEGHSPFALSFAIPCGTPGLQLPVPRQLRSRALAFRPSARLALRGDGLHRLLRRRAGAVGAGVPARRRRPAEQHRATSRIPRRIRRIRVRRRTSPNASSCWASPC